MINITAGPRHNYSFSRDTAWPGAAVLDIVCAIWYLMHMSKSSKTGPFLSVVNAALLLLSVGVIIVPVRRETGF